MPRLRAPLAHPAASAGTRCRSAVLAAMALLPWAGPPARSQEAPALSGALLLDRAYAKLTAAFSRPGKRFLVMSPALALGGDPEAAQQSLDILADQIPRVTSTYQASGHLASSTFGLLLGQEPSAFVLQADRQSALEAMRAMYDKRRPGRLTPEYQAYQDLLLQKENAEDALATAQVEQRASGQAVPSALLVQVQRLTGLLAGPAQRFQALEAAMERANDDHMAARFYRAKQAFVDACAGGTPSVVATPPVAEWASAEGWIPWKFSAKDLAIPQPPQPPAETSASRIPPVPATFLATLSIDMDVKRVTLARPWMDEGLFRSRFWRMRASAPFPSISTGQPDSPSPGPMPWRIDGLLLARDLRIRGAWEGPTNPDALKAAGALPFTPGATSPTLALSGGAAEGALALRAEGIQIIGLFCTLIPRCPDPDPLAFRTPASAP